MARRKASLTARDIKKHDSAFALFMLGLVIADISSQVKVPAKTIERWSALEKWYEAREVVLAKRNEKLGAKVLQEQESIRGMERDFAEKLMASATLALKHFKPAKCKPGDLVKILDLATKLGRLSVGLPLGTTNVDVAVRHDLGESIKAALEKVYGAPALPSIEVQSITETSGQ